MSYAKVTLIGNLGNDPDLRHTPEGVPVCSFSVATDDRPRGGTQTTTWWRVTAWGKAATTIAEHLRKGRPIYVEGRVHLSERISRDGRKEHTLEVHTTEFQFIGGGSGAGE